jgi:hypothetical protein
VALAALDRLILPALLEHPRPVAQRDLVLGPPPDRLSVGRKREEVVADGAVRFTGRRSTPPIWVRRCDISYASKKLIDNQGLFILQLFH